MPGKKIGLGSQIAVAATTAGAYDVIGGLLSWDGPNRTKPIIDMTCITDSTNDYVEKLGGYKDAGEVSLELLFYSTDDTGQTTLAAGYESSTAYAFEIYRGSTTDSKYHFKAIVQDYGEAMPGRDEAMTRSVTLALTGRPEGTT